jgi:hypothetical protein
MTNENNLYVILNGIEISRQHYLKPLRKQRAKVFNEIQESLYAMSLIEEKNILQPESLQVDLAIDEINQNHLKMGTEQVESMYETNAYLRNIIDNKTTARFIAFSVLDQYVDSLKYERVKFDKAFEDVSKIIPINNAYKNQSSLFIQSVMEPVDDTYIHGFALKQLPEVSFLTAGALGVGLAAAGIYIEPDALITTGGIASLGVAGLIKHKAKQQQGLVYEMNEVLNKAERLDELIKIYHPNNKVI